MEKESQIFNYGFLWLLLQYRGVCVCVEKEWEPVAVGSWREWLHGKTNFVQYFRMSRATFCCWCSPTRLSQQFTSVKLIQIWLLRLRSHCIKKLDNTWKWPTSELYRSDHNVKNKKQNWFIWERKLDLGHLCLYTKHSLSIITVITATMKLKSTLLMSHWTETVQIYSRAVASNN